MDWLGDGMSGQGLLFADEDPTLRAAFEKFHAENPHVYALLCRFSAEVMAAGLKHYAVKAIIERIRWHVQIETKGDEFKINNNHAPFYARLWLAEHPEFPGFFSIRAQTSAGEAPEPGRYGRGAA